MNLSDNIRLQHAALRVAQGFIRVASERMMTLLGMLLTAVAFGWVLYEPDWIRLGAACFFAAMVFWPLTRLDKERQHEPGDGT